MHVLARARAHLTPLYQQPHRAYHGLAHVEALLAAQARWAHLVQEPLALSLAIWFHDAIYDTTAADNEARSAELAASCLSEWGQPPGLIAQVRTMIEATHRHEWTDGRADTALFLDLDLGILAVPAPAYDRYSQQVAQEYAWVPPAAYRQGRARVLQAFVQRPHIYFTPALRALWESDARANLQRELACLRA